METLTLVFRRPHLLFRKPSTKRANSPESLISSELPATPTPTYTKPELLHYNDLPKWYQDNHYIRTGYRPVSNSYTTCLQSLTYLHNESLNIYTHLLPALVLAFALPTLQLNISRIYVNAPWLDRFMLTLSPIAALFTLSLSSTYHTLQNHSALVSSTCLLMDFTGILILILSSFLSGVYVGFYESPFHQWLYWGMIVTLITVSCCLVLHPRLQGPLYRTHRTTAFILTALSGFAPVFHGVCLYGWHDAYHYKGVKWWLAEAFWYGLGATFFSTRWPEKGSRKFDFVGSSHQIFHVCVAVGASCHCWGVWEAWKNDVEW
ncbi:HlyIII-domain-containing protein [Amniculicola lignicola CBS 123094]|uniref:HlyIII-domain-containing protein n=1 Tax=Amniculicola lignicola CBS 123094 TaxID=1392246 RepID=A0A6A5WI67_9PLEO|nr:HlyIII-domain-containing protein [Amniculicola lignicola CBS 123094]